MLFVDHVETLRQQGYVNKLKVLDVSQMGKTALVNVAMAASAGTGPRTARLPLVQCKRAN
ncbi:MAG: hypothetical protein JWO52_8062 [Gammaproteobacteria bacterium]|nr:hypothetical protein [Gammaproteobacteria bacterium]